jgi:hypothetical protein
LIQLSFDTAVSVQVYGTHSYLVALFQVCNIRGAGIGQVEKQNVCHGVINALNPYPANVENRVSS